MHAYAWRSIMHGRRQGGGAGSQARLGLHGGGVVFWSGHTTRVSLSGWAAVPLPGPNHRHSLHLNPTSNRISRYYYYDVCQL
jgi:hypothetical protein